MTAEEQRLAADRDHCLLETLGTILERTPMGNSQGRLQSRWCSLELLSSIMLVPVPGEKMGLPEFLIITKDYVLTRFGMADPILKEKFWFNGK